MGKGRPHAYEGIFSKLNYNYNKANKQLPKFSFFKQVEDFKTGICKRCMTRVKVKYNDGKPFMVNIEDNNYHKRWIRNRGWLCSVPKSEKGESDTMKRLKNKKWKAPEQEEQVLYIEE